MITPHLLHGKHKGNTLEVVLRPHQPRGLRGNVSEAGLFPLAVPLSNILDMTPVR